VPNYLVNSTIGLTEGSEHLVNLRGAFNPLVAKVNAKWSKIGGNALFNGLGTLFLLCPFFFSKWGTPWANGVKWETPGFQNPGLKRPCLGLHKQVGLRGHNSQKGAF